MDESRPDFGGFRNQVTLEVNLEDVEQFDAELAADVLENTRRYQGLFSDVVYELLPKYKIHEVTAKDALDVFIEHRLLVEQRAREQRETEGTGADDRVRYPPELMRR
jgi:DNA replication licensing factor MCM7